MEATQEKKDVEQQPTVITLDNINSVKILVQYIELAQQKGSFDLNEAELLKRSSDVLLNGVVDNELNQINSRQLIVQGIHKGQKSGAYTLNDAALLSKVVKFVSNHVTNLQAELMVQQQPQVIQQQPQVIQQQAQVQPQQPQVVQQQAQVQPQQPQKLEVVEESDDDDLSSLAEPIPLRPKEI
jgi:hypothetical protein